jgi:UDP-3-O-[3-hydroxymyristoyl] glucosamine N-acyltransferase
MEFRISDIVKALPVEEIVGNAQRVIRHVVRATDENVQDDCIAWVSDKNIELIAKIQHGCVICSGEAKRESFQSGVTYLVVRNPRLYFLKLVADYFVEKESAGISDKSVIDPSVKTGRNVIIRPGVVIEKNCIIGDDTRIDSNTVIRKGTIIGNRVKIGANTTIGGDGFGYEKSESGEFIFIPHIGNVVIEDDVEVGNNTAIDRAVLGSTILRKNSKVDNLVHIAHGVEVGENSLVIANTMIAGSTTIGKNVWIAPSVSILNKVRVEDDAVLGMGAVVLKNVKTGQTIVGNPGKDLQALKKS